VVASDLGFLALGGILGLLAGAALIAVLRTRQPIRRQIRLTVTPGSVPIRPSRTTLGIDPFVPESRWAAHGESADVRRLGPEVAAATVLAGEAVNGTLVRSDAPHDASSTGPEEPSASSSAAQDDATETESVGIAIGSGPDPVLAAIAASGKRLARRDQDVVVVLERPGEPGPTETSEEGLGAAILEAAIRARQAGATAKTSGADEANAAEAPESETTGSIAVLTRPEPAGAKKGHRPEARSRGISGAGSDGGQSADRPPGDGQAASAGPDQCAEARTTVDERCALAERMRVTAGHAAEVLRQAQGTYDTHIAQAAAAEAIAESRAQRAAKDDAQNRFRTERSRAGSREAVEQAARDWLQEINRINAAAREAATTLARERDAAAALQTSIERLTVEADAARLQAEGAEESCALARKNLAACEEALREAARAPGRGRSGGPGGADETRGGTPARAPAATRGSRAAASGIASTPLPAPVEEEGALAAAVRAGGNPAVLSLLTGNRAVLQRLVWELAGEDPVNQRRWQIQLADLIDAIVSRAIEACAFIFPEEHPFWEPFNRRQGRDIALALSSLGFRFDGLGGFADDRIPTQRDLSLALGYAGLDPMRVRRWPTEGEFEELYRDVTVAADEYILGAAPGLTLGELVGILGRRADPLTEVWNAWAQIRPILLEQVPG
jgi:hypothetical protein